MLSKAHASVFRLVSVLLLTLLPWVSLASDAAVFSSFPIPVVLDEDQGEYALGKHLMILEDPTGLRSIEDVRQAVSLFKRNTFSVPNFGITPSAYWAMFTVINKSRQQTRWYFEFLEPMMQWVDVWVISDTGTVLHRAAGSLRPRSPDNVDARSHVMPFELSVDTGATVFVRVKTNYVTFLPMRIWSPESFAGHVQRESIFHGIYFGLMIAMLIYNLFIYVPMREPSALYFAGYLMSILVVQACLNGSMGGLFLPDHPEYVNTLFILTYMSGTLFTLLFTVTFLPENKKIRAFSAMGILFCFLLLLLWLTLGERIWAKGFQLFVAAVFLSILLIGARSAIRGNTAAVFFTLGFGWSLASSIVFLLTTKGLVPFNSFTFHAVEIGSGMSAVLLSLAVVHKLRFLKQQNERAQEALWLANQYQVKMLTDYKDQLETEFKAHSAELIATQQKLVASEKMAALGVFTAGMAHEINNPANFVSVGTQNTAANILKMKEFVNTLLSEDVDPEIQEAFAAHFSQLEKANAIVSVGIKRIQRVVQNLRANHPEGAPDMQPINVVATLESALRVFIPSIKSPVKVAYEWKDSPTVMCVVAEMQQVFLALLSNAAHAIEDAVLKEGPEFKGDLRLCAYCETPDRASEKHQQDRPGCLVITVTDNGIGIPAEKIDKIFDPFFTTKEVGRGAGLGLSMARDVVRKHHGSLEVESRPGQGSRFILRLPCCL